ncbi:MAG: acetyl-CoA carboxylase biotin carboxylase subunit [Candidatus Aminicenantes bacterium]|nr:acetyl-CoA carboxylase biotin carboxylase subunit [Candidatus Aminicenantes bacterium]
MFSKILIANRGEIALRIMQAAKELGIKTVAVFSESDKDSLHASLADEKICIGPAKASESYLNIPNIISAALITKTDAIHPGYGFLAENPRFPEVCQQEGLAFVGPPASVMRIMGDKNRARQEMKKAKLPILPGSDGIIKDFSSAEKTAKKIGFPIILKAAAGGGGKGMRIVRSLPSLENQFNIAQNESNSAFGNPDLYIEKYFENARHIEIQVARDSKGHVIGFAERECSVQRKHQKILEETPSTYIDSKLRKKMIKAAESAADFIDYQSLGTFEFLVDRKKNFYFMEANTRVQVEHPITEMVYGIDLIKEQIQISAGQDLKISQGIEFRGHSIECRINAEDPDSFAPSPGKIEFLVFPGGEGIRIDSAAYQGWTIPPFYDSLIAKVSSHAPTRQQAIKKAITALEMTTLVGVKTNIPLQLNVLSNSDFLKGTYDTQFLEDLIAKKTSS